MKFNNWTVVFAPSFDTEDQPRTVHVRAENSLEADLAARTEVLKQLPGEVMSPEGLSEEQLQCVGIFEGHLENHMGEMVAPRQLNSYTVVFAPLYEGEMPFVMHVEAESTAAACDVAVAKVRGQLDPDALATAEPPQTVDGAMEALVYVATFAGHLENLA